MDKVYIVTNGKYDGYHIVAVYADEGMGEHHANNLSDGQCVEWEIKTAPFPVPAGMRVFYVEYSPTGDKWHVSISGDSLSLLGNAGIFKMGVYDPSKLKMSDKNTELRFRAYLVASDEQHAIEIARERRDFMISTYGDNVECEHSF